MTVKSEVKALKRMARTRRVVVEKRKNIRLHYVCLFCRKSIPATNSVKTKIHANYMVPNCPGSLSTPGIVILTYPCGAIGTFRLIGAHYTYRFDSGGPIAEASLVTDKSSTGHRCNCLTLEQGQTTIFRFNTLTDAWKVRELP